MSEEYYNPYGSEEQGQESAGQSPSSRSGERRTSSRKRKRRRRRRHPILSLILYLVIVLGSSALLATVGWIAANDVLALNKEEISAIVSVSEEDDVDDVAAMLKEEGLIEYPALFKLFCSLSHASSKITPGNYTLTTDMDYRALVTNLSASSATKVKVSVTIPEGYTVDQIFELLESKGVAKVSELQEMAAEHDYNFSFLKDIPLGDYKRLEGYLFPDTYEFYAHQDPLYVLNKMLVNFDSKVTDEMRQTIQDNGYTIQDIVTIASMIEKETDGTDRAKIASVIYNRLANTSGGTQGKLQIDATLVYINGGNVPTDEDKNIDSPYNTYLYAGLPAGPISNPGLASIKAAISPESTSYYYYALGDDGVHHYFRTYDEQVSFIRSQSLYQDSES
jgi:UPF0755 protein